jgi:hypothetical protein
LSSLCPYPDCWCLPRVRPGKRLRIPREVAHSFRFDLAHSDLKGELVNPKIAEHRGRIVKNTGDGFLAEFASVVDAVRCAVEDSGVWPSATRRSSRSNASSSVPGGGDGFEPSRSLSRKRKPESPSDRFDGSFFCGTDNSDPAFSAGAPSVPANLVRRGLAHYAG